MNGRQARNLKKPSLKWPTSASPQVFLRISIDRPMALNGPSFSTTSTGTTK